MEIYAVFRVTKTRRYYQVGKVFATDMDEAKEFVRGKYRKDRSFVLVDIRKFEEAS